MVRAALKEAISLVVLIQQTEETSILDLRGKNKPVQSNYPVYQQHVSIVILIYVHCY